MCQAAASRQQQVKSHYSDTNCSEEWKVLPLWQSHPGVNQNNDAKLMASLKILFRCESIQWYKPQWRVKGTHLWWSHLDEIQTTVKSKRYLPVNVYSDAKCTVKSEKAFACDDPGVNQHNANYSEVFKLKFMTKIFEPCFSPESTGNK